IRLRGRRLALVWNLGMYVNVLAGALVIRAAVQDGVTRGSATFALVVVGANLINFVLAASWIRVYAGTPVAVQLRRDFVPALPWIAAPNFLAAALAMLYIHTGPASLVLSLALLGAFYALLAELLSSQERRD